MTDEQEPTKITFQADDGTETTVSTSKSTYTAAEILAQGKPCTVTVLAVFPLAETASEGMPATGLILGVHKPGQPDSQAQIGTHVPESALPKVVVGATLPAKWMSGPGLPTDANLVSPDWAAI